MDEIIISLSAGKDSLAVIDICARNCKRVHAFFMYWVKGIEFQEVTLRWVERTYGIKILRLPHFEVPRIVSQQILTWHRPGAPEYKRVRMRDVEDAARIRLTGNLDTWIASGEKKTDSMQRRGMLNARGPWDKKRLHYYPVQDWTDNQVWDYLTLRKIPTPLCYQMKVNRSWDSFRGPYLDQIKEHFPKDYQRILDTFPFTEAIRKRWELYGTRTNHAVIEGPAVSD
jgi:phosphoadenosine phosphosulfate reductase